MSKQITTILARQNESDKRLKVGAYCSTEHQEQKQSLNHK